MKITVQEKIAELERRIQALEAAQPYHRAYTQTVTNVPNLQNEVFGSHWTAMWEHFSQVMKAAFK